MAMHMDPRQGAPVERLKHHPLIWLACGWRPFPATFD